MLMKLNFAIYLYILLFLFFYVSETVAYKLGTQIVRSICVNSISIVNSISTVKPISIVSSISIMYSIDIDIISM